MMNMELEVIKNIDDKEIIKVLKLVCLDKLYEKLQKGLDTELGEKGIRMSGGERQRVALARLFFDDSKKNITTTS